MTRDRSNPIMRMSPVTAELWLQKTAITNDYRSLKEWAQILYVEPPELRRWLNDQPKQWEIKAT